ncbi:CBASS cGAMP synthase [Parahaliea mediterranea]|uniref:CBASS cGAMP synthase n=1 Tax=Parahaliea mediterranea TaxID=651086 RepID=UPI001300212C|nr:hypothetical protein [Parahaliea mediterranea]
MPVRNRCHRLFYSPGEQAFLTALNLPDRLLNDLRAAREEIEQVLREGFKARRELEQRKRDKERLPLPQPRFALQGSYVYRTINAPAYPPEQQVDIDLGLYLPFDVLGDGQQPAEHVSAYFEVVESILHEYIEQRRPEWRLHTGKQTCIRVILSPTTHIDLPLYAVPQAEIDRVKNQRASNLQQVALGREHAMGRLFLDEDQWVQDVSPTVIHLAHRTKGWEPSDPLVIKTWVNDMCQQKDSKIRHICRFLKAWRDEAWQDGGGPSSIFLLAFVIAEYNVEISDYCAQLTHVIDRLEFVFDLPLYVPRPTPEDNYAQEDLRSADRIPPEKRADFEEKFRVLKHGYQSALLAATPETANAQLQRIFGERLPYAPERIDVCDERAALVAGVKRAPAQRREVRARPQGFSG